jgi:predicted  nucleic acid-binding Zn-ribbon protein
MLMVIDDIREILTAASPAPSKPFLERVDTTLTDGYAHALQLEAERWRIERRIAEVVAALPEGVDQAREPELAALAERLTSANENIAALRALLRSLRQRRTELRRDA